MWTSLAAAAAARQCLELPSVDGFGTQLVTRRDAGQRGDADEPAEPADRCPQGTRRNPQVFGQGFGRYHVTSDEKQADQTALGGARQFDRNVVRPYDLERAPAP